MKALVRAAGVVLVLTVLASCDNGDTRPSPSRPSAAPSTAASGQPAPSASGSAQCALETRPRRLLTPQDAWPAADLDAWSQDAFQLGEACDGGPVWPRSCDLFVDFLSEGWPGYRTEGAYYIAGISLLNASGISIEERLLLFRTPSSTGLSLLADQAKACKATRKPLAGDAGVYQFPLQQGRRRFLVIDRTVAIQLTVPDGVDASTLIETARRRAMEAE